MLYPPQFISSGYEYTQYIQTHIRAKETESIGIRNFLIQNNFIPSNHHYCLLRRLSSVRLSVATEKWVDP